MANKNGEESINIQEVKEKLIKQREKKWDTFFDKYENINESIDESNNAFAEEMEEEEEAEEVEDEETASNTESEEDGDCISIGDSDDEKSAPIGRQEYENAFKQYCQQSMETFERIYKQDDYEQIKEKDGSLRTVRKSVFKKESGSKATMASSMVGNSPAPRFPPIESALTKFPAIADNNNQSLAMVKATPGALATPVSSDVVSFQTDTRPFMQGGTLYLEEITTTTTTTTMTMKRIISQQDAAEHAEQEHFEQEDYGPIVVDSDEEEPTKAEPKSAKKRQYSTKTHATYENDTPKGGQRRSHVRKSEYYASQSSTPSTAKKSNGSCQEIVLYTPTAPSENKNHSVQSSTISKHKMMKMLCNSQIETTPKKTGQPNFTPRPIRIKNDEGLFFCTTEEGEKSAEEEDDPDDVLCQLRSGQRAVLLKTKNF